MTTRPSHREGLAHHVARCGGPFVRVVGPCYLTNVAADKHFSDAASPQMVIVCLQLN